MIDTNVVRVLVDSTVGVKRDQIVALCNEIDRLRGEQQTPPQGKMVDVRVAVSVTTDGEWVACSGSGIPQDEVLRYCEHETDDALYWLTATLPVPAEVEVVARVSDD